MPRISLYHLRQHPQMVGTEIVYYERIKAVVYIGSVRPLLGDCIVDFGAFLSMFPESHWKQFHSEITWIFHPGQGKHLPDWLNRVTGIGGTPIVCGIGKVPIQIVEASTRSRTPVVEVLAKFPLDNGAFTQNLLGLGGNTFRNWIFGFDYANQKAWIDY